MIRTEGSIHNICTSYLDDLGKVCLAPYEVKLTPEGSAREPDLFFVAKKNLNRLTEDRLIGAPDLAIEIVSKSSVIRYRDDKFNEYCDAGCMNIGLLIHVLTNNWLIFTVYQKFMLEYRQH